LLRSSIPPYPKYGRPDMVLLEEVSPIYLFRGRRLGQLQRARSQHGPDDSEHRLPDLTLSHAALHRVRPINCQTFTRIVNHPATDRNGTSDGGANRSHTPAAGRATLQPTSKNDVVADLYDRVGFTRADEAFFVRKLDTRADDLVTHILRTPYLHESRQSGDTAAIGRRPELAHQAFAWWTHKRIHSSGAEIEAGHT
jgi:hypothetical protein